MSVARVLAIICTTYEVSSVRDDTGGTDEVLGTFQTADPCIVTDGSAATDRECTCGTATCAVGEKCDSERREVRPLPVAAGRMQFSIGKCLQATCCSVKFKNRDTPELSQNRCFGCPVEPQCWGPIGEMERIWNKTYDKYIPTAHKDMALLKPALKEGGSVEMRAFISAVDEIYKQLGHAQEIQMMLKGLYDDLKVAASSGTKAGVDIPHVLEGALEIYVNHLLEPLKQVVMRVAAAKDKMSRKRKYCDKLVEAYPDNTLDVSSNLESLRSVVNHFDVLMKQTKDCRFTVDDEKQERQLDLNIQRSSEPITYLSKHTPVPKRKRIKFCSRKS